MKKIVNIVRSVDTKAKYRQGNIETDWVMSGRGIRQGCIPSSILLSMYTEELAVRLRRINAGVRVERDMVCMPADLKANSILIFRLQVTCDIKIKTTTIYFLLIISPLIGHV